MKESDEFDGCEDIVVREVDKSELAGVSAYQKVINLQPSVDELCNVVRKLN